MSNKHGFTKEQEQMILEINNLVSPYLIGVLEGNCSCDNCSFIRKHVQDIKIKYNEKLNLDSMFKDTKEANSQ